jgi:murein DD-endopeptidase MepM/ murein hydrolase activator NlpD
LNSFLIQAIFILKFLDISVNYNKFINKDFRSRTHPQRHPRLRWLVLTAGSVVLGVVLASTQPSPEPAAASETLRQDIAVATENTYQTIDNQPGKNLSRRIKLELPESVSRDNPEAHPSTLFTTEHEWRDLTVKRGDSLSLLFDKASIRADQIIELMQLGKDARNLTEIHPGDVIQVETSDQGELLALNYELDSFRYLRVIRDQGELQAQILKHDIETRTAYASGEIDSSLFLASQAAGLSQNLTMELANIFGWDIDFVLDIRQGDRFTIIYEEIFKDGEKVQDGNIIAAEFINQGISHRALRYVDPSSGDAGYYSPDGQSLRKAFLRSPVNFSRISSRFTRSRYHPLLHKFRSHKGVDYAASTGTPVRASGDGKVIFRGRKGGYGNVVILKHGSRYSTLYAHLSRFNGRARVGSRIKQGQVIGYVGSSGLASGPHLHYEFRINGVHRNPLTVKFPSTSPIPERHRDNFEMTTQGYVAQLDVLSRNALALNKN